MINIISSHISEQWSHNSSAGLCLSNDQEWQIPLGSVAISLLESHYIFPEGVLVYCPLIHHRIVVVNGMQKSSAWTDHSCACTCTACRCEGRTKCDHRGSLWNPPDQTRSTITKVSNRQHHYRSLPPAERWSILGWSRNSIPVLNQNQKQKSSIQTIYHQF